MIQPSQRQYRPNGDHFFTLAYPAVFVYFISVINKILENRPEKKQATRPLEKNGVTSNESLPNEKFNEKPKTETMELYWNNLIPGRGLGRALNNCYIS